VQKAKGNRTVVFSSKPVDTYSETSDSEWVDDGEDEKEESDSEDSEDEEDSCKEMASLYSIFFPRHL
jgi:hypothetical protein